MTIIHVTYKYTKRPAWINWSNVILFSETSSGGTNIQTVDGEWHEVNETPSDIVYQTPGGDLL